MFKLIPKIISLVRKKKARVVKIAFIGLDKAGKSTIIGVLQGRRVDNILPTIGFQSSSWIEKACQVVAFDLGGRDSIRRIWAHYYAEVHGAIFVLDASNQSRFDEAQMCFREATSHPFLSAKPILILANKMDQDKLFDLKALVEWVEASASKLDNHQVTVCSAKQAAHRLPKSQILTIRQGVRWLCQSVLERYSELSERVAIDMRVYHEGGQHP